MNKDNLYTDIFYEWTRENKSTNNKSLKEILKVATKNRLRNTTMVKSNKTTFSYFTETEMWHLFRPIDIDVVEPQNEFSRSREITAPYEIDVQVPVKHDFSETFERDKFDGKCFGKGELYYIC